MNPNANKLQIIDEDETELMLHTEGRVRPQEDPKEEGDNVVAYNLNHRKRVSVNLTLSTAKKMNLLYSTEKIDNKDGQGNKTDWHYGNKNNQTKKDNNNKDLKKTNNLQNQNQNKNFVNVIKKNSKTINCKEKGKVNDLQNDNHPTRNLYKSSINVVKSNKNSLVAKDPKNKMSI